MYARTCKYLVLTEVYNVLSEQQTNPKHLVHKLAVTPKKPMLLSSCRQQTFAAYALQMLLSYHSSKLCWAVHLLSKKRIAQLEICRVA